MERGEQQHEKIGDEAHAEYEPPRVEDLDTSHGPVTTAAGAAVVKGSPGSIPSAAPRKI
jgi:hypothetical protein